MLIETDETEAPDSGTKNYLAAWKQLCPMASTRLLATAKRPIGWQTVCKHVVMRFVQIIGNGLNLPGHGRWHSGDEVRI